MKKGKNLKFLMKEIRAKDILKVRQQYKKPQLEKLGDLRTLTFGSGFGPYDSGGLGEKP